MNYQEDVNILLVDDRSENLLSMEALLEGLGVAIFKATSGEEALHIMLDHDFALVMLDVLMPKMDGFETASLMRSAKKTKYTPIIFVTAISKEQKHVFKGYESGAVDYLFKPLDPEILKGKVKVFLDLYREKRSMEKTTEILNQTVKELEGANKKILEQHVSLKESEQRYRQLLESAQVGIVVVQDNELVLTNPKVLEIIGCCEDDLKSKSIIEYFHPKDRELAGSQLSMECAAKEAKSNDKFRIITKDDDTKWIQISSVEICWDGRPAIMSMYTDVTEKIMAEEEGQRLKASLDRAEKMEVVGTLAGGVAHDLNDVLSGVVSYPEIILMDLPEDSPLREPISMIQKSGKKAAAIVQDLLTLARRGVPVKEVANLNEIISDYLASPEFQKLETFHPNVRIQTELDPGLLNTSGSPLHLSKTVMNLISNAAEALPEGGVVTVCSTNQYIDSPIGEYDQVKEGDYVVLSVSDNGVGILQEDKEKIFEPFYTKKVMGRSGTGLGMAVVWGTIKDHNGYIDIESAENEGTTFTLYFPVTREEAERTPSKSVEDYIGNGELILVVDDVQEQREIASVLLKNLGYTVDVVSSGEEAVEYLEDNAIDLLILDMIMDPGIDGLDTYKNILKLNPGQRAIIASGFSETDRVKEAQKLGAGQYVKKPYTLEKIGLAVKAELSR